MKHETKLQACTNQTSTGSVSGLKNRSKSKYACTAKPQPKSKTPVNTNPNNIMLRLLSPLEGTMLSVSDSSSSRRLRRRNMVCLRAAVRAAIYAAVIWRENTQAVAASSSRSTPLRGHREKLRLFCSLRSTGGCRHGWRYTRRASNLARNGIPGGRSNLARNGDGDGSKN